MKDLVDVLKDFKSDDLKRDLFYTLSGLLFLLILNFLFHPNLDLYPNLDQFNYLGKFFTLLILAYFFARLCNEIGMLLEVILKFLLREKHRKVATENFFNKIYKYINEESYPLIKDGYINDMELESFIFSHAGVSSFYERKIRILITERCFLGFSIILTIFYSPYVSVATFLLLLRVLFSEVALFQDKLEAAHFFSEFKKTSKE